MEENSKFKFKKKITDFLESEGIVLLNYKKDGIIYIEVEDSDNVIGISNMDELQCIIKDKNNILPSTLGLFDITIQWQ